MHVASHCLLKIKETRHYSLSPDSGLPVSFSYFTPLSLLLFCLPSHVFAFTLPLAEKWMFQKQKVQYICYKIIFTWKFNGKPTTSQ